MTTRVGAAATLAIAGVPVPAASVRALGFSSSAAVEGRLQRITSDSEYDAVDVKGKIVVVRAGSPRHAARLARDNGAVGLLVVAEGSLAELSARRGRGHRRRGPSRARPSRPSSQSSSAAAGVRSARLAVTLAPERDRAFNVVAQVGRVRAARPAPAPASW